MNVYKLKAARIEHGYTQEQIAKAIGVSAKTYNRKELGLTEFNRNEILKIARILNLSLEQINAIFFNNQITDCIIVRNKMNDW